MKKQNFLTKVISIFLSLNLLLSNLLYPFTILAREAYEDDYYSEPQAAETSSPPQPQEIPYEEYYPYDQGSYYTPEAPTQPTQVQETPYEEVYYPPPVAEPPTYPTPQYQQEIPYEEIHPAPLPPAPEPQAEAPQPTTPPWVETERVQEIAYEEAHPAPTPQSFASVNPPPLVDDPQTQQAAITNYNYQGSSYERDYDNAYSEVRADLTPSPGPAQTVAEAPAAAGGFLDSAWNTISGLPGNVAQSVGSRFTSHPAQNGLGSQDSLDGSINTTVTTTTNALENAQTPQGFMNINQDECSGYGLVTRFDDKGSYQGCAFEADYSKPPPKLDPTPLFNVVSLGLYSPVSQSVETAKQTGDAKAERDRLRIPITNNFSEINPHTGDRAETPASLMVDLQNYISSEGYQNLTVEQRAQVETYEQRVKSLIDQHKVENKAWTSWGPLAAIGLLDSQGESAQVRNELKDLYRQLGLTYRDVGSERIAYDSRFDPLSKVDLSIYTPEQLAIVEQIRAKQKELFNIDAEIGVGTVMLAVDIATAGEGSALTSGAKSAARSAAKSAVKTEVEVGAKGGIRGAWDNLTGKVDDVLEGGETSVKKALDEGEPVWTGADDVALDCAIANVLGASTSIYQQLSNPGKAVLAATARPKCRVRTATIGKKDTNTKTDPQAGQPYIAGGDDAVIAANDSGNVVIADGVSLGTGPGYTASNPAAGYAAQVLDRIPINSNPNAVLEEVRGLVRTGAPEAINKAGGYGSTTFGVAKYVESGGQRNVVMVAAGDVDFAIITADGRVTFKKSGYKPGVRDTSNPSATIDASGLTESERGIPGYKYREEIIPVAEGDIYLVAVSDALVDFNVLNNGVLMKQLVVQAQNDPQKLAVLMAQEARQRALSGMGNKGLDDISVAVMDLPKQKPSAPIPPRPNVPLAPAGSVPSSTNNVSPLVIIGGGGSAVTAGIVTGYELISGNWKLPSGQASLTSTATKVPATTTPVPPTQTPVPPTGIATTVPPAATATVTKTPEQICKEANLEWNGSNCVLPSTPVAGGGNVGVGKTPKELCEESGNKWDGNLCELSSASTSTVTPIPPTQTATKVPPTKTPTPPETPTETPTEVPTVTVTPTNTATATVEAFTPTVTATGTPTETPTVVPQSCVPGESCSAVEAACGTTTYGIDKCDEVCTKQGPPCPFAPTAPAPIKSYSCDFKECLAPDPSCGTTTSGLDNCDRDCTKQGILCPVAVVSRSCTSDGSCSADEPLCGTKTLGIDNCFGVCEKQGSPCKANCISDKSCSAIIPACGKTTEGEDNCRNSCFREGPPCPTQAVVTGPQTLPEDKVPTVPPDTLINPQLRKECDPRLGYNVWVELWRVDGKEYTKAGSLTTEWCLSSAIDPDKIPVRLNACSSFACDGNTHAEVCMEEWVTPTNNLYTKVGARTGKTCGLDNIPPSQSRRAFLPNSSTLGISSLPKEKIQEFKKQLSLLQKIKKIIFGKEVFAQEQKTPAKVAEKVDAFSINRPMSQKDYALTVAANQLKSELETGGKVNIENIIQNILDNLIIQPIGVKTADGIKVTTGGDGSVSFDAEQDTYTVLDLSKVSGATLTAPAKVRVEKGITMVYIAVTEGKEEVKKVESTDLVEHLHKDANFSKVKVMTFYDKNNNGKLDKDEKVVPWAGITITFGKTFPDQAVKLNQGWNLITIPAIPQKPISASNLLGEIAKQGGYATTVSKLEDGAWKSYVKRGETDYSGDDFTIEVGQAYFVKVLKPVAFKFSGQEFVAPLKNRLVSGWNAVGLPKTKKVYKASEVIDEINTKNGALDAVARWQFSLWDTLVKKQEQKYGKDFLFENNRGYLIRLDKGGEFEL